MIEQFSPLTRRFLAIGSALLFILLIFELIILPLSARVEASRVELADARFEVARLENISRRPPPPDGDAVDMSLLLKAKDGQAATAQLQNQLETLAQQLGLEVTLSFASDADAMPDRISGNISVTGPEEQIMLLVSQWENGRPLMRVKNWRIEYDPQLPGQINFTARLTAAWQKL